MIENDERSSDPREQTDASADRPADPMTLPPPTRGMRRFAVALFGLLGVVLIAFVLLNPFSIPFLPGSGHRDGAVGTTGGTPLFVQQPNLYQCSMHPEVIQSAPGNCPICEMELMPVTDPSLRPADRERPDAAGTTAVGEREILYWYAPMDPTFISAEPGLSPMGMKLVPKYRDEISTEEGIIRIDSGQIQNIGVVSEPVRIIDLKRIIRTVGILDFDADNVYWINTKFSGWIEKVYVNYAGQKIRKGQPLFEIYSPELVTTQEEYLRALEYQASLAGSTRPEVMKQAQDLLNSTRQRLDYWDISSGQIAVLEQNQRVQRTLKVTSPIDGVVVDVMDEALKGMFVRPGMNLYRLANLSSIWVHVDAYESDLAWIRVGQAADVELSYFPGQTFNGKVLFMQPELDRKTRTVKICVELPNPRLRLKPGMYANVRIKGRALKGVIAVPDSAILRSGERNVVFLDLGEGRFLPRQVELGMQGEGNLVEIRQGLTGDETVVVQAQFMLDSESRVQEAIRKFMTGRSQPAPPSSEAPSNVTDPTQHDH